MFFSASKILWFFLTPSNLMLALLLIGVLLLWTQFWQFGRKLSFLMLVLLLIAGLSPLGNALLLPLENRFPQWEAGRISPAGIIVLGGAGLDDVTLARGQVSLNESAERLTEAASLARRFPMAKLVFTGGDGDLFRSVGSEADDARNLFVKLGVPSSQITIERESRNTYENAQLVAKTVQQKPGETWLLITSASHMPRAVGCFRKAGMNVVPYPVDYRTRNWLDAASFAAEASSGLRRTDTVIREWVGLITYFLFGYTDALFPGEQ